MLRTHRAGKGPGGCRGWGLGSRNRRGLGLPPPLFSEAGDLTWEPSRLPGLEWAGQMLSVLLPLLPEGHSHLPLLISWASPLPPRTHAASRGLWRRGTGLGAQQALRAGWARRSPSAPLLLLPEAPLACLS